MKKYSLILGSQSPRRKELLGWLKIPFEILVADVDESTSITNPEEMATFLAKKKGVEVLKTCQKRSAFGESFFPLIVAADTVVAVDGSILGKPTDPNDARRMLHDLADKFHRVITGVYVGWYSIEEKKIKERIFYSKTSVKFEEIPDDYMDIYIESGESMDKAGAYGIQGPALTFISEVQGSYSNVVGFPLSDFILKIKDEFGENWRKQFHDNSK